MSPMTSNAATNEGWKVMGGVLRTLRRVQEPTLSLETLAAKVGRSPSHLSKVENGHAEISFSTLEAIAEATKTPLTTILNEYLQRRYPFVRVRRNTRRP